MYLFNPLQLPPLSQSLAHMYEEALKVLPDTKVVGKAKSSRSERQGVLWQGRVKAWKEEEKAWDQEEQVSRLCPLVYPGSILLEEESI